jgi:hypothetical protein
MVTDRHRSHRRRRKAARMTLGIVLALGLAAIVVGLVLMAALLPGE